MIALRHAFSDTRGRAGSLHGQPFVYRGRAAEHDYLYLIEVWTGAEFIQRLACSDEIFMDAAA